ncbi:hypothetical protein [Streptomyces tropicalis]|uniref:Protein kinase domain-containing protein n=1 Tax=Streptomyces tropicalis TaxID=3034234 RepID=A0ABT6A6E9_9ACTN|nr:hypothetical protein [Streptomyces tropicalis]MDF3300048.1 hypothetical protein [Streptomyces tropicalis]
MTDLNNTSLEPDFFWDTDDTDGIDVPADEGPTGTFYAPEAEGARMTAGADAELAGRSGRGWDPVERMIRPVGEPAQVRMVKASDDSALGALRSATPQDQDSLDIAVRILMGTSQLVVPVLLDVLPASTGQGTRYITTWATGDAIETDATRQEDDSLAHKMALGLRTSPTQALELIAPLGALLEEAAERGLFPVELSPDHLIVDNGSLRLTGFSRHGYAPQRGIRPAWANASEWTRGLLGDEEPPADPEALRRYQFRALWALAGWLGSGRPPATWQAVTGDEHLQAYLRSAGFRINPFAHRAMSAAVLTDAVREQRGADAVAEIAGSAAVVVYDAGAALHARYDEKYLRSLTGGVYRARVRSRSESDGVVYRAVLPGNIPVRLIQPKNVTAAHTAEIDTWILVEVTSYDLGLDKHGNHRGLRGRQVLQGTPVSLPERQSVNPEAIRLAALLERRNPVLGIARIGSRDITGDLAGLLGTSGWVLTEDGPADLLERVVELCQEETGTAPDVYLVSVSQDSLGPRARAACRIHQLVPDAEVTFAVQSASDGTTLPVRWQELPFVYDIDLSMVRKEVYPNSTAGKSAARQAFPVAFAARATDPEVPSKFITSTHDIFKDKLHRRPDILVLTAADLAARRRTLGTSRVEEHLRNLADARHLLSALPLVGPVVSDVVRTVGDRQVGTAIPALMGLSGWLDVLAPDWDELCQVLATEGLHLRRACGQLAAVAEAITLAPELRPFLLDLVLADADVATLRAFHAQDVIGRAASVLHDAGPVLARTLADALAAAPSGGKTAADVRDWVLALIDRVDFCRALPSAEDAQYLVPSEAVRLLDKDRTSDKHLRVWGTATPGIVNRAGEVGYDVGRLPELLRRVGVTESKVHLVTRELLKVDQRVWADAHRVDQDLLRAWWDSFGDLQLLLPLAEGRWTADELAELAELADGDLQVLAEWLGGPLNAETLRATRRFAQEVGLHAAQVADLYSEGSWELPENHRELAEMVRAAVREGADLPGLLAEWPDRLPHYRRSGAAALWYPVAALRLAGALGLAAESAAEFVEVDAKRLNAACEVLGRRPVLARSLSQARPASVRELMPLLEHLPDQLTPDDVDRLAKSSDPVRDGRIAQASGQPLHVVSLVRRAFPEATPEQMAKLVLIGALVSDLQPSELQSLAALELDNEVYAKVAETHLALRGGPHVIGLVKRYGSAALHAALAPMPVFDRVLLLTAMAKLPPVRVAALELRADHMAPLARAENRSAGTFEALAAHGGGLFPLLCGEHSTQVVHFLKEHSHTPEMADCLVAGGTSALEPLRTHGFALVQVLTLAGVHPSGAEDAATALTTVDSVLAGGRPLSRRAVGRLLNHTPLYARETHDRVRIPLAAQVLRRGLEESADQARLLLLADNAVYGLGT